MRHRISSPFSAMAAVGVLLAGSAQATALPITLFEDQASGDPPGMFNDWDPAVSGAGFWHANYVAQGQFLEFTLLDNQASIRQITDNPISFWYITGASGPMQIELAIPGWTVTDPIVVDMVGNNVWNQEIVQFNEAAVVGNQSLDRDALHDIRFQTTELAALQFGREVGYDYIQVIPEPGSLALLGLGGLLLLRRRR